MKRLFGYLRLGAQVLLTILNVLDGFLNPGVPAGAPGSENAAADANPQAFIPDDDDFKPERIQFWLELIGHTCLAAAEVIGEETGKPRGPESGAAETVEE